MESLTENECGLPTYKQATNPPFTERIIASYLDRKTLLTTIRLNKQWSKASHEQLWADPVKTAMGTTRPWQSIYRFMLLAENGTRRIPFLYVRILDFRPLLEQPTSLRYSEDAIIRDNIIDASWVLSHHPFVPFLTCTILDGLKYGDEGPIQDALQDNESMATYLLSATHIPDLRSTTLLNHRIFEHINFLDLSYSPQPVDWARQFSQISLPSLRIVKLRGLRLTDGNIPTNILYNKLRLWSLDLTDNLLTDATLRLLRASCFASSLKYPKTLQENFMAHVPPPLYRATALSGEIYDVKYEAPPFRNDSKDYLIRHYTPTKVAGEIDPYLFASGLTHLHISNNKITSDTILEHLELNNRLQYLDIGSTPGPITYDGDQIPYTINYFFGPADLYFNPLPFSGLRYLRIHHSAVTGIPTIVPSISPNTFLAQHIPIAESAWEPLSIALFKPEHAYSLRELVLTSIPSLSCGRLIETLKDFLRSCQKQEEELTRLRSYGESRRKPELYDGLRLLRLEIINECPREGLGVDGGSSRVIRANPNARGGLSVSEDRDAETFQEESSKDFSFFSFTDSSPSSSKPKPKPKFNTKSARGNIREEGYEVKPFKGMEYQVPQWEAEFETMSQDEKYAYQGGSGDLSKLVDKVEKRMGRVEPSIGVWRPRFVDVVEGLRAFRRDKSEERWRGILEVARMG